MCNRCEMWFYSRITTDGSNSIKKQDLLGIFFCSSYSENVTDIIYISRVFIWSLTTGVTEMKNNHARVYFSLAKFIGYGLVAIVFEIDFCRDFQTRKTLRWLTKLQYIYFFFIVKKIRILKLKSRLKSDRTEND